jgi:hypothetical protein
MSTWGWTPESFAAVGTVGALAATGAVLVRETFARIRAQAERVVVWIDWGDHHGTQTLFLYMRNDSALPITDIHAEYTIPSATEAPWGGSIRAPVLAPGKETRWGLDVVVRGAVEYTDAAGRRWRRALSGGLPQRVWRPPPAFYD